MKHQEGSGATTCRYRDLGHGWGRERRSGFSNFGSLKSTETIQIGDFSVLARMCFSNFGSLKSTETFDVVGDVVEPDGFSNFGSLKSTETDSSESDSTTTDPFSNFGSLKSTETSSPG